MGIDALTSALATVPSPAVGSAGVPREQQESAPRTDVAQPAVPRVVFNPRSHFDTSAGVFVMEYRSASTGEVERQFPDENQLRAYANAKKLEASRTQAEPAAEPKPEGSSPPATADSPPAQAAAPRAPAPVRLEV
jgi:hypothetical protein